MCLITTQREPSIAVTDMVVYKALVRVSPGLAQSPFVNHQYEVGVLYKTTIASSNRWTCFDGVDRDVLQTLPEYKGWQRGRAGIFYYGAGFHSMLELKRCTDYCESTSFLDAYKCTIPAGSEYYTNPSGLVVSNKIIVEGRVDLTNH